jgi:hypothetical protein
LINHPFEGGAIAKTVLVSLRRDIGQGKKLIVGECCFVFAQAHFFDAVVELFAFLLFLDQRFLPPSGIPPETYEYRLGNRSAIEWVIDQYQVLDGQAQRHH